MIRANRVEGLRDFIKNIVMEILDEMGLIKPARPVSPPNPKKVTRKAKKVASILLVFGLASLLFSGGAFALIRPRNIDEVTTNAWTFQSVVIPSSLTVTGSSTITGSQTFTGDMDINAALDVDVPTTSTIGIQFTTTTDAAAGEIGITAGQDVDIDAAGDDVLIDAADDIDLTSVDDTSVNTTDGTIALDANGATLGDIDIDAADDVLIDSADDTVVTAVGVLDLNGATVDIDATDDITIDVTSGTAGEDILITQVGANDSSITLRAAGTGSDAIGIQAAAGGIDMDAIGASDGDISIRAGDDISIGATGDAQLYGTGTLDLDGTTITMDAGDDIAIVVTSGTDGEDLLLTNVGGHNSSVTITSAGTGTDAIGIQATAGAIDIDAIGASDGDITIDAGDDMTITVVGALALDSGDWDIGATGIMSGIGTIGCGKVSSTAGVDLGTSQALTGTTALTIGAGTETVAIDSSDWDIDATGIMSGIGTVGCGAVTTSGIVTLENAETIDNSTNGVVEITGNVLIDGTGPNWGGTSTGANANSHVVDITPDIGTLVTGLQVSFISHTTSTGASTLVVDSLASKAIFNSNDAAAVAANDIIQNAIITVIYDGTQWQITSGNNSN